MSDGRDWASNARSSDARLAANRTNEMFSVRLVQSSNPAAGTGGLTPISPSVGAVSSLPGGMGNASVVRSPEDNRSFRGRSQKTIDTLSDGSFGVKYDPTHSKSADRTLRQSGRGSGPGQLDNDNNPNSAYSAYPFQSNHQRGYRENEHGTRYQKREASRDTMDDTVQYPYTRLSGPLSPMSPNIDWRSTSVKNMPARPRLVDFTRERGAENSSRTGHRSGEVVFV